MAKETAEEKLLKMLGKTPDLSAVKSKFKPNFNFAFSIRTVNQVLLFGIIVCLVGLFLEIRSGVGLLHETPDFAGDIKKSAVASDVALPSGQAAAYYLDQIHSRNIFKPYEAKSSGKISGQDSLAKRMGKYKLVGIAWLDLPETASVMIEDTEKHETYFLKTTEQLEGVTVKTIYTDRAVFSYENEEIIIKL